MPSTATRAASSALSVTLLVVATGATAQPRATAEEARNEAANRRHHDAIDRGDIPAAAAFYADTVRNNGDVIDRARLFAIMQDNSRTFPDWTMRIDRLGARGDDVVALMTVTGTHRGVSQRPVNGGVYLGVAPTGRSFYWFKLKDGLIVEHRATRDDLGVSRQLGLLPPAPPRPPAE